MSQEIIEQLSALMDGELPDDQMRFMLRRFDADPELAQRWSRYHLVRACLRHEVDVASIPNLSAAVMTRLAQESADTGAGRAIRSWLRWTGGGAIAAAVAVVALLVSRPVADGGVQAPTTAAAVTTPASAPRMADESIRLPMIEAPINYLPAAYYYTQPTRTDVLGTVSPLGSAPYAFGHAPVWQSPQLETAQDRATEAVAAQHK